MGRAAGSRARASAPSSRASVLADLPAYISFLFYSYRRATLRGEPDYGRQLSAIALAG